LSKPTITIIDTFGFFFRSYFALPPLTNKDGFPTGLLTGFLNFVSSFDRDFKTDYILFALDAKGNSFRNEIDPEYKAHRDEAPEDLKRQLPIAIEWIEKMGFSTLGQAGFEADDIIATVAEIAKNRGFHVNIVSHDKDLYQLIDDGNVVCIDAIKRKKMDEDACFAKYGIWPKQFVDYQSLLGDSADNVPGVKGIGKVTAEKLLVAHESLDKMYENIESVEPPRIRGLLETYKEDAFRSRKLVTLARDVFSEVDFHTFDKPDEPLMKIVDELFEYEMNAQIRVLKAQGKLDETSVPKAEVKAQKKLEFQAILLDDEEKLFEVIDAIDKDAIVALDTETTGLDWKKDQLVGYSFAINDKEGYYVPFLHSYLGVGPQVSIESAKKALHNLLTRKIVGHNLKFDLAFIYKWLEIEAIAIHTDTMVLAWLVDSANRISLDVLAERFFNHDMISFKQTVKKGENFSSVALEDATNYAAEDAWITYKIYEHLLEVIKDRGGEMLLKEASSLEYPFIQTLIEMERQGIRLDDAFLENLKSTFKTQLDALSLQIHEDAGETFNINSTKQLGVILFEKLELPVGKKTKTGYSTDEKVLSGLKGKHPIIEKLLQYRELFKLYSTYVDPLLELCLEDENHKIYTSFVQTGTATGRLSSKNPNLQNIPTKTEMGKLIRDAFVASEGKTFIGIDYSQIELRLLAHYSQDKVLVDSFNAGKDIHLQTAIKLFGEEEAAQKRNIAKTVNFGLLYGMGPKKLGETLGLSNKEAKGIIDNYFSSFPTVKSFLSQIAEQSQETSFVETLLGRRRWFDYKSAPAMMIAMYKREAVNTVFQGSAADLIKMAMNKIALMIKYENLPAKMLLQIHDELIFEVDESHAQDLAKRFKETMETIHKLSIPLECSVAIAKRWGELK